MCEQPVYLRKIEELGKPVVFHAREFGRLFKVQWNVMLGALALQLFLEELNIEKPGLACGRNKGVPAVTHIIHGELQVL